MNNKLNMPGKKAGIWMDQEKAYIIIMEGDHEPVIEEINSDIELRERFQGEKGTATRFGEYIVGEREKKQRRQQHERAKYYKNIINHLQDADGIFIFGPGETKHEMAKAIKKAPVLRGKLFALENSDQLTLNQMKAKVKEFFSEK
jgi:stalled ribosome rescue protein Dom34